jgi:hypothetical protein
MLYKELLALKNNDKLEPEEIVNINNILKKSNIRIKRRKLTPDLIKLKELNNKKKSISSKINQIINKISIVNYKDIVIEFLQNININEEDYLETFNEIFLQKIYTENNFVKSFAYFYKDLVYGIKYFYNTEIDILENLLNNIFINIDESNQKYENIITFMYYLIENKYYDNNLYHKIFLDLYNNNLYYLVYIWLNLNKQVLNKYKFYLEQIDKSKLDMRINVLLNSLNKNEEPIIIVNKVKRNKLEVEIENILDEYLELEDEDEIKLYISENLKTTENKNLFKNICLKHKNKKVNKLVIFV